MRHSTYSCSTRPGRPAGRPAGMRARQGCPSLLHYIGLGSPRGSSSDLLLSLSLASFCLRGESVVRGSLVVHVQCYYSSMSSAGASEASSSASAADIDSSDGTDSGFGLMNRNKGKWLKIRHRL